MVSDAQASTATPAAGSTCAGRTSHAMVPPLGSLPSTGFIFRGGHGAQKMSTKGAEPAVDVLTFLDVPRQGLVIYLTPGMGYRVYWGGSPCGVWLARLRSPYAVPPFPPPPPSLSGIHLTPSACCTPVPCPWYPRYPQYPEAPVTCGAHSGSGVVVFAC